VSSKISLIICHHTLLCITLVQYNKREVDYKISLTNKLYLVPTFLLNTDNDMLK